MIDSGDDPGRDLIPVKDLNPTTKPRIISAGTHEEKIGDGSHELRMIGKWPRDELEDRYIRVYEENMILKKHAHNQEDKIKRMATKLLRLINDRKKQESRGLAGKKLDPESQVAMDEMQDKIRDLENQNRILRDKLMVARQQLASQLKRPIPGPYRHVSAKVDTGAQRSLPKTPRSASQESGLARASMPYLPIHRNIAWDNRQEEPPWEEIVAQLRDQLEVYEQEIESLREQLKSKYSTEEGHISAAKLQTAQGQRQTLQENVALIRIQRELQQKMTELNSLHVKYNALEENMLVTKTSHEKILREIDLLNSKLKEEQQKTLHLQGELASVAPNNIAMAELQERLSDLERENKILKDTNEKLTSSLLDSDRERSFIAAETSLRIQVAQLEATLKADLEEKKSLLENFTKERDAKLKAEGELKELRMTHLRLTHDYEDAKEKLSILEQDSDLNLTELEEALSLMRIRKEEASNNVDFLTKVGPQDTESSKQNFLKLQADHVDTVNELEKTRNMLVLQNRINRDYKEEIELVNGHLQQLKREHDTRLNEQARLLDMRATRIHKLEKQIHDIAYGTRQYKTEIPLSEDDQLEDSTSSVHIERGENIFEIHIKRIVLTEEALKLIEDSDPTTFATWSFFHFEIKSTPVLRGRMPQYDCTAQYVVEVDDIFLHYLHKEGVKVEMHQAFGVEYTTLAACTLSLRDLLEKSGCRLHGTVPLLGIREGETGVIFGNIDFWVRLRIPVEQTIRMYKERSKALGYMRSNMVTVDKALKILDSDVKSHPSDGTNELHVKVIRCAGLKARIGYGAQPSPYCVYKFYDNSDHDTPTVTSSNDPEFNDHTIYNLTTDSLLDQYLRTEVLELYVFDDNDPEMTEFLGVASIPLLPLAHNKPLQGTFQLTKPDGSKCGSVDVSLYWLYPYVASRILENDTNSEKSLPKLKELDCGKEFADKAQLLQSDAIPVPKPRTLRTKEIAEVIARANAANTHPAVENNTEAKSSPYHNQSAQNSAITEELTAFQDHHNGPATSMKNNDNAAKSDSPQIVKAKPPIAGGPKERSLLKKESPLKPSTGVIDYSSAQLQQPGGSNLRSENESEIIMPSMPSKRSAEASDTIVISVNHLSFLDLAPVMRDSTVQMLFVEYRFLDFPTEELETPFALPKPKPAQEIAFDFRKVFAVDHEHNLVHRQHLAGLLLPDSPDNGRIQFTIVSEPPEDSKDVECEDIGYSYVDLHQIVKRGQDVIEEDIEVYDASNVSLVIGHLNVTVECLKVLNAVMEELNYVS